RRPGPSPSRRCVRPRPGCRPARELRPCRRRRWRPRTGCVSWGRGYQRRASPVASESHSQGDLMADQLAPPSGALDTSKSYTAIFKTEKGDITVELFADRAPLTVENFVTLARAGFYDGTTFHRVIGGVMAQGGDPTGTGTGGPGYQF